MRCNGEVNIAVDILDELIQELGSENEIVRMRAGETLISLGPIAVEPLIRALESSDHPARYLIASTLGCIGEKSATPALIRALRDKDPLVRLHAAAALGKLKDSRAVEPLIHSLFDATGQSGIHPFTGEPLTVRAAAAQSLGELKDKRAVPALISALSDPNGSVRRAAVQALMQIGDQRAIEALSNMLQVETDQNIRLLIIKAIWHIGGEKAIHILQELTRHEDKQIAEAAKALKLRTSASHPLRRRDDADKHIGFKGRVVIVPTLSASLSAGALLCAAFAIYTVVESPMMALIMLSLAATLAVAAGLTIALWHRRKTRRWLEFSLKRCKSKNKCR